MRKLKPTPDNFLVRWLKAQLPAAAADAASSTAGLTLAVMAGLMAVTVGLLPTVGREFMPELEEGNLWIRGEFPVNIALPRRRPRWSDEARAIMQQYPEVETIVTQIGRPDDGTDPSGFYNVEFFVPLKPQKEWPAVKSRQGWAALFGAKRPRTKAELIDDMNAELSQNLLGVDWNFSQNIRDNVMESLSGVKGDNSVKIVGPDLDELERLADEVKKIARRHSGHRGRRRLPHQGAAEPGIPRRSRRSASAGASAWPTCRT